MIQFLIVDDVSKSFIKYTALFCPLTTFAVAMGMLTAAINASQFFRNIVAEYP